jgi:hypothetical protein
MLSARALRRARRLTGLPFVRAYIRGGYGEGVVVPGEGKHEHHAFNPKTGFSKQIDPVIHWASCPDD